MNKRLEKKLRYRSELGDHKAAFEFAHLLASSHQYKRYKEIIDFFKVAANAGISEAMFWLGLIYEEDWNPLNSKNTAFSWYLMAAKANHPEACNSVALCYERGNGVKANISEGRKWLEKGAQLGDSSAQFNLALNFEQGNGVKLNLKQALRWYEAAALQEHPEAGYKVRKIKREMAKKLPQLSKNTAKLRL